MGRDLDAQDRSFAEQVLSAETNTCPRRKILMRKRLVIKLQFVVGTRKSFKKKSKLRFLLPQNYALGLLSTLLKEKLPEIF